MPPRAKSKADDRRAEIMGVARDALRDAPPPASLITACDAPLVDALGDQGVLVTAWHRFAEPGVTATPWPAGGVWDGAVIRLPGGWAAFEMTLSALCARVPAGASVWIYGGSEEGITSVESHTLDLITDLEVVALKRRTRVLRATRTDVAAKGAITDWMGVGELALDGVATAITSRHFPGCFAEGRLDAGTALLLSAVETLKDERRVLDFASGAGIVAQAIATRFPTTRLTLLDADSLALHAAALNLPGADIILGDGVGSLARGQRFDLILSNPPIHRGRQEDFTVLTDLIAHARDHLRRDGALLLVVQRTGGVAKLFPTKGPPATVVRETSAFQVWRLPA